MAIAHFSNFSTVHSSTVAEGKELTTKKKNSSVKSSHICQQNVKARARKDVLFLLSCSRNFFVNFLLLLLTKENTPYMSHFFLWHLLCWVSFWMISCFGYHLGSTGWLPHLALNLYNYVSLDWELLSILYLTHSLNFKHFPVFVY